jgi:hypothetical protein
MRKLMTALTVSGMVTAGSVIFAQDAVSLVELAKRRGRNEATVIVEREIPPTPLPDLVDMSVMVLRGRVIKAETHLSDDESNVYTDYVVAPLEVLKQPADFAIAARPGPGAGIVVRKLGGTVKVGGFTLRTQTESDAWDIPVRIGDDYLLFLSRGSGRSEVRPSTGLFHLTNVHLSIFAVQGGRLKAMSLQTTASSLLPTDQADEVFALVRDMVAKNR